MDTTLKGRRIKLIQMGNDPNPIQPGSEGTIAFQDDMKNIHVAWDNGRTLSLIPGVDQYEIKPITNFPPPRRRN